MGSCFSGLSPVPRLTAAPGTAPVLGRGGPELRSPPVSLARSLLYSEQGSDWGTGRVLGSGGIGGG